MPIRLASGTSISPRAQATPRALAPREKLALGRRMVDAGQAAAGDDRAADRSFGSRRIIDDILSVSSFDLSIEFASDSFEMLRNLARSGEVITFQIEVGSEVSWLEPGLISVPVADADPTHGPLVLGHLRGRTLPVAAAKFVELVAQRLDASRHLPSIQTET